MPKLKLIFKVYGVQEGKILIAPVCGSPDPNRLATLVGIQRKK